MLTPGLVSVTFRKLSPEQIIDLVKRAGLRSIEWGGDVHVPHGDTDRARDVAEKTAAAGLEVAAYGSYYRLGQTGDDAPDFARVLATAAALGAPLIRVWPGVRGSAETPDGERQRVESDALRVAQLASEAGIGIAYEYHGGTLTDTNESAQQLLERTDHPAISTIWQPPNGQPFESCLDGLKALLPRLSNVHAFHWWPTPANRHPLEVGADRWKPYLDTVRQAGGDRHVLIEFVKDDAPEQLLADAATLRNWLEE